MEVIDHERVTVPLLAKKIIIMCDFNFFKMCRAYLL